MSVCSVNDATRGDICAPSRAIELPIGGDIRGVAGSAVDFPRRAPRKRVFAKAFHAQCDSGGARVEAPGSACVVTQDGCASGAAANDDRRQKVRVLHGDKRNVFFSECYVPDEKSNEAMAIAWVDGCSTHAELFQVIEAVSAQPAAIPFNLKGRVYSTAPIPANVLVADLSGVAALAVLRLSRDYYAQACALPGIVGDTVQRATTMLYELRHLVGVRRVDLQWFWQSCQLRLRQNWTPHRAALLTAAIETPWEFEAGTQVFCDFVNISKRCEARFATPGTDIYVSGTAAAAVSLRDKTLMLLLMLWWDETHYVAGCPAETPACIATLIDDVK